MMCPHGNLTPAQIRTTFFVVPALGIQLAYGQKFFCGFATQKEALQAMGGDLLLIGWPDGTTVQYSRPIENLPIDAEDLAGMYRQFHELRTQRETQGEQS